MIYEDSVLNSVPFEPGPFFPFSRDWFKDNLRGHIYRRPDRQAEVLEIDGFVQMQVLKGGHFGTVESLQKYCSRPLRKRRLAESNLYSCGSWACLTIDNEISELWLITD